MKPKLILFSLLLVAAAIAVFAADPAYLGGRSQLTSTTVDADTNFIVMVRGSSTNAPYANISISNLLAKMVAMGIPTSNTIWVKPTDNLATTVTAASAGSVIIASPGLYSTGVTNLLKNGVGWYGLPGATISNNNYHSSIWDNSAYGRSGAITSSVVWLGTVMDVGPDDFLDHDRGVLVVSNSASRISFKLHEWLGGVDATEYGGISIVDCSDVDFDVDIAIADHFAPTVAVGGVMFWKNGTISHGRISYAHLFGGYAYNGRGTAAGDAHLEFGRIVYTDGDQGIYHRPTHVDNTAWITIGEMENSLPNGQGISQHGGQLHVDFNRIGARLGIRFTNDLSAAKLWVRGNKLTKDSATGWFWNLGGGFAHIDVQEWEDLTTGGSSDFSGVSTAGTNYIGPGSMRVGSGPAISHLGGSTRIRGLDIDSTAATGSITNSPIYVAGAGLELSGVRTRSATLVSNAITATSAQTVTASGLLSLDRSNSLNITIAGAVTNHTGTLQVNGSLFLPAGASASKVWTATDTTGLGSWQTASGGSGGPSTNAPPWPGTLTGTGSTNLIIDFLLLGATNDITITPTVNFAIVCTNVTPGTVKRIAIRQPAAGFITCTTNGVYPNFGSVRIGTTVTGFNLTTNQGYTDMVSLYGYTNLAAVVGNITGFAP